MVAQEFIAVPNKNQSSYSPFISQELCQVQCNSNIMEWVFNPLRNFSAARIVKVDRKNASPPQNLYYFISFTFDLLHLRGMSFTLRVIVVLSLPSPIIEAMLQAGSVSRMKVKHRSKLSLTPLKELFQNFTQQFLSHWGALCFKIVHSTETRKQLFRGIHLHLYLNQVCQ